MVLRRRFSAIALSGGFSLEASWRRKEEGLLKRDVSVHVESLELS